MYSGSLVVPIGGSDIFGIRGTQFVFASDPGGTDPPISLDPAIEFTPVLEDGTRQEVGRIVEISPGAFSA